ncbi:efflux RND transporter periplasmic adaptor subunit [Candidatus Laterigemmans baculatus]|uniref:efflux RND transporter periplasmic adaptor subunit n=1 Tax=Candidatus Laterigemmans baculatus TaxID=2770505 RepID=UPI0013DCFDC6|nr:efflux RND transporter periplasmic adaptor subunit [Candidatus Laterigemmans baculatus]
MRLFQWLRGSSGFRSGGLRSWGLEILGFGLLLAFLILALSLDWHHSLPGFGGAADGVAGSGAAQQAHADHAGHDHSDHDHSDHDHAGHDHAGHEEADSIELSDQARRSLQLETAVAQLGTFVRRLSVPATIVDWPGRTHVNIAAPLTGTVTSLHVSSGETIASGAPLYTLRLTHQDLVQTQSNFLQMLGRADVEQREVERLSEVAESGAIARKSLLERQYELDKLQAGLRAERESLMLHGLSEAQVDQIERTRRLIREVTVYAPVLHDDRSLHDDAVSGPLSPSSPLSPSGPLAPSRDALPRDAPQPVQQIDFTAPPELESHEHREHIEAQFVVAELAARRGQSVSAGETLVVLANYETLLAEGLAFQQDAETLTAAARNDWPVQAVLEGVDKQPVVLNDLAIAFVAGEVQQNSRALPFYVPLENEVVQQEQRGEERYVVWRFKPGQRLRLRVPIEQTSDVFVLPVDAIASEGLERYVFIENGDHFDRRPVHIVARDQLSVAVANDGSLLPGETVAISGAHQLQMALKNKAGGGVDPHAGHNH